MNALPSNRFFGLFMSGACLVFLGVGYWKSRSFNSVLVCLAFTFAVAALVYPKALHPLNRAWAALGYLLGKVMNPIVMAVIFFVVIVPMGILMRLLGKDPLSLRLNHEARSYWKVRSPPGPQGESLKQQF